MLKKDRLKKHVRHRALERCGIVVGRDHLLELARKIQSNDGVFIRKLSNRVTEWEVEVHGEMRRVLYDKQRKAIITFLPLINRVRGASIG